MKVFMKASLLAVPVMGSPITKVIELINELKVKVEADLSAEKTAMSEYSEFCDDESAEKGFAIKTAGDQIEGYQAVIEETTGNIQELAATIESAGAEVADKTSELGSATSVRKNESDDFKAAEEELVDAVDTLGRAITIIKREMSFVQAGKQSKTKVSAEMRDMANALSVVISAAYIDSSSRQKLKSFLSTDMDEELSLHAKQPQASTYAYESKSGGIVSTLDDMKDKAANTLKNLRREEMKSTHAFEMIKQSLTDAVTVLNKEIEESKAASSAAEEKLGKAEGDLSSTEAAKKADEEYLAKLTSECTAKASEWSERQATAKLEIEALAKGAEILSSKFGSFAQVALKTKRVAAVKDASRERAVSVLKKLGRQFNSFGLMQIANAASSDPFGKVRGLIENMIAKLEQQAQEEATQDAFCKEETAKSAKAKQTKEAGVAKYQARIDEANAAYNELKDEVATLSQEIADINAANKKATDMRNSENAAFVKASTDFKESAEAVTQALVVLKEFYKGGAEFVQTQVSQGPEFAAAKGDGSYMIIGILEDAQADFTRLLAEAETDESEALEAFKALMQANAVSMAEKEVSVKAKTSEMKSIQVALTHHKEDYETTSSELEAVMDYIKKLKPQCESKAMSYEERKARRDAEIAGLQEALEILSGDSVASFIEKKAFLSRKSKQTVL